MTLKLIKHSTRVNMRIQKKTVSLLLLSRREIEVLMDMVEEAKNGQTVHYSERQTGHNSFFGVHVDEANDENNNPANRPKQPMSVPAKH